MPNALTGDFQAVVQIAVRQLNGLLAALHQNGAASDAALKLLHSVHMRLGEPRRRPPDLGGFGDWALDFKRAASDPSVTSFRDQLVAGAPPGASGRVLASFAVFDPDLVLEIPPETIKGRARLQLSTIRLSMVEGSTSEVTVHADVRAHYIPDAGTTPLAEFVHGEVRAVFEVRRVVSQRRTRLVIQPSAQDQKIEFIPAAGSGLTGGDTIRIAAQVRKALREGLLLLPVDLPSGFPFADFTAVGSGAGAAIALPLQLSGGGPPAGSISSVTQSFIGSNGFAFAVAREHVASLVDIEAIRAAITQRPVVFRINLLFGSVNVTYRLRFSSGPTLTFRPGVIEISGRVAAESDALLAPSGFVSFTQKVELRLSVARQRVRLRALGAPSVDESFFIPHGRAVDIVRSEIATALADNNPAVEQIFDDAKASLVSALRTFDRTMSASYAQLDVSSAGVVIGGALSAAPRIAPVVRVDETDEGRAFTAFQSWIPGGRILRLRWSWVEFPPGAVTAWSGVARSATESHRFILPKPPGITEVSRICLRIEGSRTRPDGGEEAVSGGTVCLMAEPGLTLNLPSWWEPLAVPVWFPGLGDDAVLAGGIAAHVSVQADRPQHELTSNAIVFFPDWQSGTPFDTLSAALGRMRDRHVALAIVVIVPQGSFNVTRRAFESRLAALPPSIARRVQVAEDAEGGWTRTFAVTKVPSLFVVNARRQFVYASAGELDPKEIGAALDARLTPAPAPRFRPLVVRASVGERAPDVHFRDDRGDQHALHRLRGRPVAFTFWQSWSAPCLEELRRLQHLQDEGKAARFVVAFHGGPAPKDFDGLRKQHQLRMSIVQDAEHRVARAFGVRCWPTTIEIDGGGVIEHIQMGLVPRDLRETGTDGPKAV